MPNHVSRCEDQGEIGSENARSACGATRLETQVPAPLRAEWSPRLAIVELHEEAPDLVPSRSESCIFRGDDIDGHLSERVPALGPRYHLRLAQPRDELGGLLRSDSLLLEAAPREVRWGGVNQGWCTLVVGGLGGLFRRC